MKVIGYINNVPLDEIPIESQKVLFGEMMNRAAEAIGKEYLHKDEKNKVVEELLKKHK